MPKSIMEMAFLLMETANPLMEMAKSIMEMTNPLMEMAKSVIEVPKTRIYLRTAFLYSIINSNKIPS